MPLATAADNDSDG